MSFIKGFTSLFDWMFPQTYQEMSDDLDSRMRNLYDKNNWGKYINPIYNTSIDYTRSIGDNEHNKIVEQVYGDVKAVTSSQFLDEMLKLAATHKSSSCFEPYAYYNEDLDRIQAYFKNEDCYVKTLNNNIELHISFDSREVVGINILNIKRLLNKDGFDAQN